MRCAKPEPFVEPQSGISLCYAERARLAGLSSTIKTVQVETFKVTAPAYKVLRSCD